MKKTTIYLLESIDRYFNEEWKEVRYAIESDYELICTEFSLLSNHGHGHCRVRKIEIEEGGYTWSVVLQSWEGEED